MGDAPKRLVHNPKTSPDPITIQKSYMIQKPRIYNYIYIYTYMCIYNIIQESYSNG